MFQCRCGAYSVALTDLPSKSSLYSGGVYFVGCAEYIKIGKTDNFPGRLASLQAQNPITLEPLGFLPSEPHSKEVFYAERAMHGRFQALHHHHEWFHRHPDLVKWINEHTLNPAPFLVKLTSIWA